MVSALWTGADPRAVVPERYRPPPPKPREMTPEEREIALEIGVQALGTALRRMTPAEE